MKTKVLFLFFIIAIFVRCTEPKAEVILEISNPLSVDRNNEIVEISGNDLRQILALSTEKSIVVTDVSGHQIPYQFVTNGTDSVELLILLVSVKADESDIFRISEGTPECFQPMVYGRFVPERKDDFTWENNRVAYRVYGPALQATGEVSNGMDFWAKKTDSLIIDKWYKNDLSNIASYHQDHGEGLDFYKVGRTLGLGMTSPFHNDKLILGSNFITYKVLDNGPLRLSVRFTYAPYDVIGNSVSETRIISLDAYQNLNKVINVFESDTTDLELATGIVMLADKPEVTYSNKSSIMAYEVPSDSINGTIYTGVIRPEGFGNIKIADGHYLGINEYETGAPYIYYAGGGWSKGDFNSFGEWIELLNEQKEKLDNPLVVSFK